MSSGTAIGSPLGSTTGVVVRPPPDDSDDDVMPRFHTVQPDDHVRLMAMLGDTSPANFDYMFHSALCKRIRQSFHGKVQLKPGCILCSNLVARGDVGGASIDLGKYVAVGEWVLIRPPAIVRLESNTVEVPSVTVGEHVLIGKETVVEACRIGSCVIIESNCILGPNCEVHHGTWIKANTVVPRDMKLAPFGVYEGHPARLVGLIHPDAGLAEIRELVLDTIRRTGLLSLAD